MSTTQMVTYVTSIGGSGTVVSPYYVDVADSVYGYVTGAHIQKAFKVRFTNDELTRSLELPYVWKSPIEFKEDIGAL